MGQGGSAEAPHLTLEQLNHKLAQRFAQKSYTPLELYCFNSVFRSLADTESGVKYWSESTLCRFLELPDALAVGPILFQMSSYLGAFPFPSQAPAILTYEALLKVVTILTERYGAVIKKRSREIWLRELYRSLAVHDRGLRQDDGDAGPNGEKETQPKAGGNKGFAIDAPEEGGEDDDDDDELVLAALDSMDADEVFKHGEHSDVHHSIIPTDNFLRLVELLLLMAPIDAQESLSSFSGDLTAERKENLRQTASGILSSFGVSTTQPGITYRTFNTVVSSCLPYLFNGLNPLFDHFLFAKDLDLSKRKPGSSSPTTEKHPVIPPPKPALEPVLRDTGEILDLTVLSQLSFFLKGSDLFRRLRPLYSGNTHGFSMGSFEKQAFNWRAPTILLVSGRLLSDSPSSTRERAFADSLPPKRYPSSATTDSSSSDQIYTFGAYVPAQWKLTHKGCFGDASTLLFQLSPTHDVFSASAYSDDYIYFNRPPTYPSGLGFGTPVPRQSASSSAHHNSLLRPGPVSLHLDDALEFGVFTHLAEGGGSFHPSRLPVRKGKNWQDRFEIESLEVWGCGGDEVAEAQRKEWAFQEREAEARRRINLGTGDIDADRELLKMAGLIGQAQSGGSV